MSSLDAFAFSSQYEGHGTHLIQPREVEAVGKQSEEPRRGVQFRLQLILVKKST